MSAHEYYVLEFMSSSVQFIIEDSCVPIFEQIFAFFRTHFSIRKGAISQPNVSCSVSPYYGFDRTRFKPTEFSFQIIRKSSAESFNLFGEKALAEGLEIIDSQMTQTAVVFNAADHTVGLYISDRSHIQVIELIRDLLIKHEEEVGTLVLHAAGVVYNDEAWALVGSKGSGKSTLLLELLSCDDYMFLSGDKLFLRVIDDNIIAYGWPDYPHIGHATILAHPKLATEVKALGYDVSPLTPDEKILFPAQTLRQAFNLRYSPGPAVLRKVILPGIESPQKISIQVSREPLSDQVVKCLEFSIDNPFSKWHSFMPPISVEQAIQSANRLRQLLTGCTFLIAEGRGPLSHRDLQALQS